jgi:hypothetical protein
MAVQTNRKDYRMNRIRIVFAALCLAAIAGFAPQSQAQTVKVMIAGSSAMWQTLALGAYNNGTSIVAGGGVTHHYTSSANFNLSDTRSTVATVDTGAIWIVWDSAATANVWAYIKVDSVVGVRCYFARPACGVSVAAFPAVGNAITVWPDASTDTLPPAAITTLFTTAAQSVSVAATDIRPEDAAFAQCRVNSALGASTAGGANSDGLDGLGYNTNNAAGVCPVYSAGTAQSKGVGNPILSGYPASTSKANVLAFNITGKDPITNTTVPAYTVTAVGAAPIIFITAKTGVLANLNSASEQQLQQVFSGTDCNANAFGLPAGAINVFLREPLSGTYNTTEATVMRYPTTYDEFGGGANGNQVGGLSMETSVGANNPLAGQAGTCSGGGQRFRGIGTGEEVKAVLNSNAAGVFPTARDGIGFTFFSYGNVSTIANNANFGYIALNGVDPIFQSYGAGQSIDPGQPSGNGKLPAQANLPASCPTGFPCQENFIWGNGFSFPNLRNGTYRSWSLLRLVATGTANTNAVALKTASNKYVVSNTPDYVPATAVTCNPTACPGVTGTISDLGLKLVRSHYQQYDGARVKLGLAATVADTCNVPEKGGDMGGMIIPTTIGVVTEKRCSIVQHSTPDGGLSPAVKPAQVVN